MNWFWLHRDPARSARKTCDQHVVKMIVEACQLLYTAMAARGQDGWYKTCPDKKPYKPSHVNHPLGIWVRLRKENFNALLTHALAMSREYTFRFEKTHATNKHLVWMVENGVSQWTRPLTCMALKHARAEYATGTWLASSSCPRGCSPVPVCAGAYQDTLLEHLRLQRVSEEELTRVYRCLYNIKARKGFSMRYTQRKQWVPRPVIVES